LTKLKIDDIIIKNINNELIKMNFLMDGGEIN